MYRALFPLVSRAAPALILLPLIASCGAEEAVTPAPASVAAASFAEAYADASCRLAERCNHDAPYLLDLCKTARAAALGDVTAAITADRIAYDPALGGACIDGILGTDCASARYADATLAACYGALKGKVAVSAPCFSFYECAAGFCDGTGACPQTCQPTLGEGESCAFHFGPACDGRLGLLCSAGTCVRPVAAGKPCVDNNGCQSGLICVVTGAGKPNLCEPLHPKGGICSNDSTCAAGLYCNAASDEGGGCEERKHLGEACGHDADEIDAALRGSQCEEGLVCWGAGLAQDGTNLAGVCEHPVGEGARCLTDPPALQAHVSGCQEGLVCSAGVCAPPPSEGACAAYGACHPGAAYCSPMNTCVALSPNGAACAADAECASGRCDATGCIDKVKYCPAP